MRGEQRVLLGINLVGGVAVLGSYAWGALAQPAAMGALWGGVPEAARGLYVVNMFVAAFGYFLFTPYILFRLLPAAAELAGRSSFFVLAALYIAILLPSALWLPLTAWMVESPSTLLWWLVKADLALVALGSGGLLAMLCLQEAEKRARGHALAVLGLLAFCLQTVVLDAIVWPLYFPTGSG